MSLTWTDSNIIANSTEIRKSHIDEIRDYLNKHVDVVSYTVNTHGKYIGDPVHPTATPSTDGFMSASDKALLTSISVSAGSILSVAGSGAIGSTGGTTPVISIRPATPNVEGSLSAIDKAKLDAMIDVPTRLTILEGRPGTGTVTSVSASPGNPEITIDGPTSEVVITIATATPDPHGQNGLLSSSDKAKLDMADGFPVGTTMFWFDPGTETAPGVFDTSTPGYGTFFDGNGRGRTGTPFKNWIVLNGGPDCPLVPNDSGTPVRLNMLDIFPLGASVGSDRTKSGQSKFYKGSGDAGADANWKSGEKIHVLTTDEIPAHTHQIKVRTQGLDASLNDLHAIQTSSTNFDNTETTGGGQPHNNMPPFVRFYFIYKYKTA